MTALSAALKAARASRETHAEGDNVKMGITRTLHAVRKAMRNVEFGHVESIREVKVRLPVEVHGVWVVLVVDICPGNPRTPSHDIDIFHDIPDHTTVYASVFNNIHPSTPPDLAELRFWPAQNILDGDVDFRFTMWQEDCSRTKTVFVNAVSEDDAVRAAPMIAAVMDAVWHGDYEPQLRTGCIKS